MYRLCNSQCPLSTHNTCNTHTHSTQPWPKVSVRCHRRAACEQSNGRVLSPVLPETKRTEDAEP